MKLDWEVRPVEAKEVTRFVRLDARLSSPQFNIRDLGVPGGRNSKETPIEYKLKHVVPPECLFVMGRNWRILNTRVTLSFGGTVSPTADGFQLAELLAQRAVVEHEALVIGGGVIGVDMAAHLGALDVRGRTVAVLANPVDLGLHPYQPRRAFLEEGILKEGGLLVSEYDEPSDDRSQRLLDRDRVITALSDFFIAIECSRNSGTVDAAKRAKIQGKKVLAVDWSRVERKWHEPKNSGAQQLFDEGVAEAFPVGNVSDIKDPRLLEQFDELLRGA